MKPERRIRLERYVINPGIKLVLRSPLHGLMSANFAVVSYRGRRTGRRRSLPVAYAPSPGGGWVISAGDASVKSWWRNFTEGRELRLVVGGRAVSARAHLARSPDDIERAREIYVERFPRFRDSLTADADVRFLIVDPPAGQP